MKVTYNADVCTHAGECVKGAPNVFKVVDGQFVIDTAADSFSNSTTGTTLSKTGMCDEISETKQSMNSSSSESIYSEKCGFVVGCQNDLSGGPVIMKVKLESESTVRVHLLPKYFQPMYFGTFRNRRARSTRKALDLLIFKRATILLALSAARTKQTPPTSRNGCTAETTDQNDVGHIRRSSVVIRR